MLHRAKRWVVQNIINQHPKLKERVFPIYSKYVAWVTKRDVQRRLNSLKPEEYYSLEDIERKNVIIITADCMRFKNTSQAGYHRDTTPFLTAIGNNYRAISGAPWTYPSVPTILSGLYPTRHGAYIHNRKKHLDTLEYLRGIKGEVITLPELLLYLGYEVYMATAIGLSSYHFRKRIPNIQWYPGETRAEKILEEFLKWAKKRRGHFFAYLHLGDPHEPLNPPERYWNYFGKVKRLKNIEKWAYTRPEEWKTPEFKEYVENRILLYDNVLRYVNDQIEELFSKLEKMRLLEDTLIVITADHGEEFWEHATLEADNFYDERGEYGFGHGHNVFREITEVPLTMYGFEKLKEHEVVSLTDVTPTILKEIGIRPKFKMDGIPLQETQPKNRVILTEAAGYGYEKKALLWKNFKLLHAKEDNVKWVFNLKKDPAENNPITNSEVVEIFEDMLKKLMVKLSSESFKD